MRFKASFLLLVLFATSCIAEPQLIWLHTKGGSETVPARFEQLVFDYLHSKEQRFRSAQPSTIVNPAVELQALQSRNQDTPLIVLQCSMPEYLKMLKDPAMRELFDTLHLQWRNSRLFSFPFYLVSRKEGVAQNLANVAWISLQDGDAHPVEDADVLTMLSEALGKPRKEIHVVRERGAYPMAKRLQEGEYGLAGVYEEDPATLLEEFRLNWTEELKADAFQYFQFDSQRVISQIIPVATGRFSYLFFEYRTNAFLNVPASKPILAIAHEINHPFPVLLSNVDSFPGSAGVISNALSYAYFQMPASAELKQLPAAMKKQVEQLYLLNSYLEDPESRIKGLGLLGALLMRKERMEGGRQREIYQSKCNLFQRKIQLSQTDGARILEWMGIHNVSYKRRELFSNDVSRLYEEAVAETDSAISRTGAERIHMLENARAKLASALLQHPKPSNVQGSRGLWSVADYNPYYQLARIALFLELEKHRVSR